ncbi:PLK protein kinase [Phytophthora nicotianae P10297]|uniref:PLK protein kinase n=1 Tax=Phytophthora nicotianae P10297 TaxID=1317064 RepID=W2YWI9_PHYNI|nr:PLK protein kinase [Phytophthora nicotianae P10297]
MEHVSDVADTSSRAPHSISEYTLLEFLGEGATAQVYLAEHEASGAHVAIKVIDKLLVQRAQLESKVRQEMVLHAELRHPHVLHVESVFEDARNYYMVLEHCARRSLSAVVKALPGRKVDEQTVKKIFRQVVAGVVYLHASGVIHRDLKLANLLLNDKGEVKISDFGLAARLGDDHVTMCGTPNFIAPEVLLAEDEPYDEAVDVWSLGCILYCLLLGKPPFEGRKVSETLENVANAGQNPLKFPDGFSSSASDLIKRLLTPDPLSRPSAQQILLHPWLRDQSQKRAPPQSNGRRKSLPRMPQPVPPHPRAASRSPEKLRESRRAAGIRAMKEEGSSDSSFSPDDDSIIDDYSDLSELSLPTPFNDHTESKEVNGEMEKNSQLDEKSFLAVSRDVEPIVSVVIHLELQDVSCFGLFQSHEGHSSDAKVQLQWSCKEPAEVGRPPTYELKVSNGWEAYYDQASGVLTATTPQGDPLRYEIPGVSGARAGFSASSSFRSSTTRISQRPYLPPFVRFCQCLALRTMQLRRIALRGQASKLPFIHYDTLPESLLESFRYRSNLLTVPHQAALRPDQERSISSVIKAQKGVEIAGVGSGCIDSTGDLRVVFLDGAQLTLAASGLQLRFRPSWATGVNSGDSVKEDVFELLTTSSMSSFLPSSVKQKLESIPEFIRRLKAVN